MTRVRLLSERCRTCVFGTNPPVPPARVRQVIQDNLREGTLLMCHSTLYGQADAEAMCRGYWDAHRHRTNTARVMDRLSAAWDGKPWWEEVPPPEH